jgi:hypothetical protein
MNVSIASTLSYSTLPSVMHDLMKDALYDEGISGTCMIDMRDDDTTIRFSLTLTEDHQLLLGDPVEIADVYVQMKANIMLAVLLNLDKFDLRSPFILTEFKAEGNLKLAEFLFNLIKRPADEVEHHHAKIRERSAGQINLVSEIKRISQPSAETVMEHLREGIPFIATGVLSHWTFLTMSLDQIKKVFGHIKLSPGVGDSPAKSVTIKEFIGKMEQPSNAKVYTEGCELPEALRHKFQFPFMGAQAFLTQQMWLGTKSGEKPCTRLHCDCTHNFLGHIIGRKRIVFYSPDQSDYLYPHKAYNTYQPCHILQGEDVDTEKFPLFKNAKPIEVILQPGELMVIPAFWFHCVYALDNVLSVSSPVSWAAYGQGH